MRIYTDKPADNRGQITTSYKSPNNWECGDRQAHHTVDKLDRDRRRAGRSHPRPHGSHAPSPRYPCSSSSQQRRHFIICCSAGPTTYPPPTARPRPPRLPTDGACLSMAANIPRPGPANLSTNAGLDEWLDEAKQCHYLPERAMKELCEKVKEILMEGELRCARSLGPC